LSHIANVRDHRTTPEYSALLVLLLHGKTHSSCSGHNSSLWLAAGVAVDVARAFLAKWKTNLLQSLTKQEYALGALFSETIDNRATPAA
jgi:hypothetical protein